MLLSISLCIAITGVVNEFAFSPQPCSGRGADPDLLVPVSSTFDIVRGVTTNRVRERRRRRGHKQIASRNTLRRRSADNGAR
jgi:hypothetical protein